MSLLDAHEEGLAQSFDKVPLEAPKPKEAKFSTWATLKAAPKGFIGGIAEGAGSTADVLQGFGSVLGATEAGSAGMFGGQSQKEKAEANKAREALLKNGPDYISEGGRSFRNVSKDYIPDPETAHLSENIVGNAFRLLGKVAIASAAVGPIPGAVAAGAEEGFTVADDLAMKDVDKVTRTKVGAFTWALTAASFGIPVAGKTLARTVGMVLAGGPMSFMAQQAGTSKILENANYAELSKQYDPFDPWGIVLATGLPFAFAAGVHGARAVRAKQSAAATFSKPSVKQKVQPTAQQTIAQAATKDVAPVAPAVSQDAIDAAMTHNLTLLRDAQTLRTQAVSKPVLPDGISIRPSVAGFEAIDQSGKVIGRLESNITPDQAKQINESASVDIVKVDPQYKGQGVGSALYDAFNSAFEGNITPSGKTSADAWKLWKRNYPEKVDLFVQQEAARIKQGADTAQVLSNITDAQVKKQVLESLDSQQNQAVAQQTTAQLATKDVAKYDYQAIYEKQGGLGDVNESLDIGLKSETFKEIAQKEGWSIGYSDARGKYFRLEKDLGRDAEGYNQIVAVKVRVSDHSKTNQNTHFGEHDINIAPDDGYARDTFDNAINKLRNARFDENGNTVFDAPDKTATVITEQGITVAETGKPITLYFNRNTKSLGNAPAGMDVGKAIEPTGEYMNVATTELKAASTDWEAGAISFKNPLVLDHISTDSTGWKKTLSTMFDGKTGKSLTAAIKKAGYDAVITQDKYGYSETVNLSGTKGLPQTGKDATVITERGMQVQTRYKLVEADTLVTSHGNDLTANPAFPAELQPRDRSRAASADQIARIENQIRPELLGESVKASDGAPIVGPDAVVESGNARTIALRRAYQSGKADEYRAWLSGNAERFGATSEAVASMKRPVLVRERTGNIDRAEFTRQANESPVAALSPTEQARADAARTKDLGGLVPNEDGSVNMSQSAAWVRSFMQGVPPNERGAMMQADGQLSQAGAQRIRNAVFAKAYGDPAILSALSKSTNSNIKNILSGLLRAAPEVAKLQDLIASGARQPMDFAPDLVRAVRELSDLRARGVSVEQHLTQGSMFDGGLPAELNNLLVGLSENARSPKRIAEMVKSMVQAVDNLGDPRQASLLSDAPPTRGDLTANAVERMRTLTDAQLTDTLPETFKPSTDPLMRSIADRVAAAEATHGDLQVGTTADGQPITIAQKLERVRREALDGTPDELGTNEVNLVQVAADCFLSTGV
jgi:ribosomal protein S18 acetylase RimI-like enzyme